MTNKYALADARLAALKGWVDVTIEDGQDGDYRLYGRLNNSSGFEDVPLWSQDPGAAMQLMAEHNVWPHASPSHIHVQGNEYYEALCAERFSDHGGDVQLTIRFALVQATTIKLEEALDQRQATSQPVPMIPRAPAPAGFERRSRGPRHLGIGRRPDRAQAAQNADYFGMLVEREHRLAQVLGWHDLKIHKAVDQRFTVIEGIAPGGSVSITLPKWTRDPSAAWALMRETGCSPIIDGDSIRVIGPGCSAPVRVADHADKNHAMQFAVVEGAIRMQELTLERSHTARMSSPGPT